jgi:hypothetical protein
MGQELQVPDWAKTKRMASAFAGLNPQEDRLSDGIEQSYGIIGYKGKTWSIRADGQKHNFVRPDDGTQAAYIDGVIVGQNKARSKSYYPKDKGYEDGGNLRPVCASINGVVPDPDVQQKQHDNCAMCPRNVWLTNAQTGKKGKECSDYKRIAFLLLPPQTERLFGKPLMEPVFLRVPADSLKNLAAMDTMMSDQGFHYLSYVTRISFDPNKPHPCMVFKAIQGLGEDEGKAVIEMSKHPLVRRITGGGDAPAITHQDAPAPVTNGNGSRTSIDYVAASAAMEEPQVPLDDAPVAQVSAVADAGVPEESDAAMDALIANLTAQHLNASK